jgi:hypothetical protein
MHKRKLEAIVILERNNTQNLKKKIKRRKIQGSFEKMEASQEVAFAHFLGFKTCRYCKN